MSTTELKSEVFARLEQVNEAYLFEEILGILELEATKNKVIQIPKDYQEDLEKSMSQLTEGKVESNNKVEKSIEKWLYK